MGFGIQVLNTELHFLELMIGVCERKGAGTIGELTLGLDSPDALSYGSYLL